MTFEDFRQRHPLYDSAVKKLQASSFLLELSALFVYENHGEALGPVADDILIFVDQVYPSEYLENYISRVNALGILQENFDASPSINTIGDCNAKVDVDAYSLSLLLSIVFTNHRFEIMRQLALFLRSLKSSSPQGTIASVGTGTGYELKIASEILSCWKIQGYDTDAGMRAKAERWLDFFGISKNIELRDYFPLGQCPPSMRKSYDAIILCEVLEHLVDPAQALVTLKECINDAGQIFLTMAINIAQEDHVFLYPDIKTCRRQIQRCGLEITREYICRQSVFPESKDRESVFKKGNYIAVVRKAGS